MELLFVFALWTTAIWSLVRSHPGGETTQSKFPSVFVDLEVE